MRLREQSRGVNGKKDYGRGHGEAIEDWSKEPKDFQA